MKDSHCITCGKELSASKIKNKQINCGECLALNRLNFLTSKEYINKNFSKEWVAKLYSGFFNFLSIRNLSCTTIERHLRSATRFLNIVNRDLYKPQDITTTWFNRNTEGLNKNLKTSFETYLIEIGVLAFRDQDEIHINAIENQITSVPPNFRRLLEVYFNERLNYRKRQKDLKSSKIYSLRTVETSIGSYIRLVKWLNKNFPELTSWDLIQEVNVNEFLLTLNNNHREVVRKLLLVLFKLGFKKRILTHIPLVDLPSREYPRVIQHLTLNEQKRLSHKIREEAFNDPLTCLMTSLCFYNALTSREIFNIKLDDIDLDKKIIVFSNRPNLYLNKEDLILLEQYLIKRAEIKNSNLKPHLFISKNFSYNNNKTVPKTFISKKVKSFTGFTPQQLRITSLYMMASMYGPQYLVEAIGLSLTQATRYGKMSEYLIEEEVKEQQKSFIKLSKQLK